MGDQLLATTKRVTFELSNRCPYASEHKLCPLHLQHRGEPVTLPAKVVLGVMDSLVQRGWKGLIGFHNYSKPTSDPRLFWFIREAHERGFGVLIWSNGWNMSQILLDELVAQGVTEFHLSAYGDEERLSKLVASVPITIDPGFPLDGRLHLYEFPENDLRILCHAPLREMVVTCKGQIALCCLDWRGDHAMGNLYLQSFDEILESGILHEVQARLSQGDRYLNLCRRCLQGR